MTRSHRIRLHSAWRRLSGAGVIAPQELHTWSEPPAAQAVGAVGGKFISLPDTALRDCAAPRVTYCRQFNRPSGIGPEDRIWIDCDLFASATRVLLNGQEIPSPEPGQRLEITDLLRPHNELRVVVAAESFAKASLAAVAELTIETDT